MERIYITLPDGLKTRAHDLGINVSKASANAVSEMVKKVEQEKTVTSEAG
jgi:post-segregation antitoxin (ccd killing protein)